MLGFLCVVFSWGSIVKCISG